MKTRKSLFLCACVIVLLGFVYGFCHFLLLVRVLPKKSIVTSELFHLRDRLFDYRRSTGRWPNSLADVIGDGVALIDSVSEEPYVFFPDARPNSSDVLVAQPEPFQAGLWPLGGTKRKALLATGELRSFYGEEVFTLGKRMKRNLKQSTNKQ